MFILLLKKLCRRHTTAQIKNLFRSLGRMSTAVVCVGDSSSSKNRLARIAPIGKVQRQRSCKPEGKHGNSAARPAIHT